VRFPEHPAKPADRSDRRMRGREERYDVLASTWGGLPAFGHAPDDRLLSHLWQQSEFVEALLRPPTASPVSAALRPRDGLRFPAGGPGWDRPVVTDCRY
jgi:hypothetical protein